MIVALSTLAVGALLVLTEIQTGSAATQSPTEWDLFGNALAGVDDLDGDGLADLLVGDPPRWRGNSPRPFAWAVSPARGEALFSVGSESEQLAGQRPLLGLGDVDGDGLPDFAACLRVEGEGLPSLELWLCSGKDGARLATRRLVEGERLHVHAISMHDPGDFDGDGGRDLLIAGNWAAYPPHEDRRSRVWVLSASTLETLLELEPNGEDPPFLPAAAAIGDVDGDGRRDLAITLGNPQYLTGRLRLVSGADGRTLEHWESTERSWVWPDLLAVASQDEHGGPDLLVLDLVELGQYTRRPRLSLLSGAEGAVLSARTLERKKLKRPHLTQLSDLDADGFAEVLLCDHDFLSPGYALVLSGKDWTTLHETAEQEDEVPFFDHFGVSSTGLGDVDGDGVPDYAVGAANSWGKSRGFVEVFSGKDGHRLRRITRKDVLKD